MPSSSTRRIFPVGDWAPAHEHLYHEADNDSSIDTLPFPSKLGEASVSVSVSACPSSASSMIAPPRRRNTTKKHRSMSLPWRPKSALLQHTHTTLDDSEARSDTDTDVETNADVVDSRLETHPQLGVFAGWSGFSEEQGAGNMSSTGAAGGIPQHAATYKGKDKGKKSVSDMLRRASVSFKDLVHRRKSIATETLMLQDPVEPMPKRQSRHDRAPSLSHQLFSNRSSSISANNGKRSASVGFGVVPSSPASPAPSPRSNLNRSLQSPLLSPLQDQHQSTARPITSHTLNATWHRLRNATSFRNSRILYGDSVPSSHEQQQSSLTQELPDSSLFRSGVDKELAIIAHDAGAGAQSPAAAAASWQHDMFGSAAQPLKNKRLTLDSTHNDRESGIGIAVTSNDSVADGLQDLAMATFASDVVEGACAPSRVDFVSRLPVELAIQVLAYLDAAGLATASRISTRWHDIVAVQHVWRESYLREKTGTYATSEPIEPGTGLGVPANAPGIDWKHTYRATEELAKRWRQGKATSIYLNGHSDSIYCLQFDERKIITGSRDKTIRIWDMETMACKVVIGPPEVVHDDALLHDAEGKPIHSASFEPHLGADARSKCVTSVPTPVSFQTHHKASILCLQYDEHILVTGSSDGSCIVYDMKNGYRPIRRLRHHSAAVLDLCFDDRHIVTCSKDVSICVWDRATGQMLKQLRGHSGPVNAVQMRGNTIVSCSGDFMVKLWNIETGKQIREFQGHTKGLACSQFSEDGRYVASAGNDKVIRIWDANTGECLREMKAHESLVRSLHIDSVSGRLVSGSYDTDIKVFDMETGRQLLDFPRWHASWVLSAKSDYRRIVSTGQDPKILVMDFGAGIPGIEQLESPNSGHDGIQEVSSDPIVDGGYI
ncbi:WD40-repeat-containing domain protein [Coniella lustricola]|uniref:WD40-repeat-containing domain protein n=1 Tax=Coniella lustricola TaxID=2025994 RepID=A0A2T3A165_9PEZI|nr:WD40-repeat-containing domain protein [Coniella lustricola]